MTEPENITLTQLQAIRRELTAVLERQETFIRQIGRLADAQADLARQMGDLKGGVSDIRSDVILLESHNLTRHNETLSVLTRLEGLDNRTSELERAVERRREFVEIGPDPTENK